MVDLIVRGAGVLGLTVAWEAAKRGLKVCILIPTVLRVCKWGNSWRARTMFQKIGIQKSSFNFKV